MTDQLDPERLDKTLRSFIAELDYDIHKSWERNEEDGKDDYHLLVKAFIECWEDSK